MLAPAGFRRDDGGESAALFRRSLEELGAKGRSRRIWRGLGGAVEVVGAEWLDMLRPMRTRRREVGMRGSWKAAAHQAARAVTRSPGVGLGVVALLGLGIGATLTVLSVVEGVLLRPLPYPDADRLLLVEQGAHSWPDYLDWRDNVPVLDRVVAGSGFSLTLAADVLQEVEGARVSAGFFELFGARTALGRLPTDTELERRAPVAVLSYAAWERRWGSDPDIVGRTLTLNGVATEVVGVLSDDFIAPRPMTGAADVFLALDPDMSLGVGDRSWTVVARLRGGGTLDEARAALLERAEGRAVVEPRIYLDEAGNLRRTFPPVPLREAIAGDARTPLMILLAGAVLLLLVAVCNAAALLVARSAARRGEIAIRRALGAGSALNVQLVLEAVLLSFAGGLVGVVVALGGLESIQALDPGDVPRVETLTIDGRVALWAGALALLAGVMAGWVPALRSSRVGPAQMLRRSDSGTRGRTTGVAGRGLVVVEAALASLLLAGSMTVVHGLRGLLETDPGFDPSDAWTVSINVGREAAEADRVLAARQIRERLTRLAGAQAVGAGVTLPYEIHSGRRCCWWGSLAYGEVEIADLWVHPVTPGYFEAVGIDMVAGRGFNPDDSSDGVTPVVLNGVATRALFGEGTAVGQQIRFDERELIVAGVVGDVQHWGADQPVEPEVYVPYDAMGAWASSLRFVVRGQVAPQRSEIVGAVAEVAPSAIVSEMQAFDALMSDSLARQRFYSLVLTTFAGVALALAMAGLAGTLLYDARQRRHELGVRMALGAPSGRMARAVLMRGLATVGVGAVLGLAAYWPLRRFAGSVVPGVETVAPGALVWFTVLLSAAVVIASWAPARLVAATDPARALRPD